MNQGAAMVTREGDFGFSAPNGDPEGGHDVLAFNFSRPGQPFSFTKQRFAFNCAVANQTASTTSMLQSSIAKARSRSADQHPSTLSTSFTRLLRR